MNPPMTPHERLCHRIGFLEGVIEGIRLYAVWKNGEQLVGCRQRPLNEVLTPYKEELARLVDGLPVWRDATPALACPSKEVES